MLIHACLLLAVIQQGDERIKIRRPDPQQPAPAVQTDELQQDDFHQECLQLRRSLYLPTSKESAIVQRIGQTYDRIPDRCLELMRISDPDLTHALMQVLRAYGSPAEAKELEFLLLTRSFGTATEEVVRTMASLARDDAQELLFACLSANRASVRRYAERELHGRLRPGDAARLIELSRQGKKDVRVKALRLLGSTAGTQPVIDRLVQSLGEDPQIAEAACRALISQGDPAVPALQDILRRPAIGRNYGYAALALVGIEDDHGSDDRFTEDMLEPMLAELDMPDRFQRSAVALALAGMAWRSEDVTGERYHDREIVDALIEVVTPSLPIASLSLLQGYGVRRLMLFVGQDFGASHRLWRSWWEQVKGDTRFVGSRRRVQITLDNAELASLEWRGALREIVFYGERFSEPKQSDDCFAVLMTGPELVELVQELETLGFMRAVRLQRGSADGRSLRLLVGGASTRSDPQLASALLDRLQSRVDRAFAAQSWQLYRDPDHEPDAAAYWRAERRWREQHSEDSEALLDRLKTRIIAMLPRLSGARQEMALLELAGIPDLPERLTEEDGMFLADAVAATAEWDEHTLRMMDLALLAPGEEVWHELVRIAEERDARAGTRDALARIFSLIGPDRILESIANGSPRVRRVAIEEVARLHDQRAVEPLLAIALDVEEELQMRRTAIYALGQLQAEEARTPLIEMLDGEGVDQRVARTTWVALARIGGDEVFLVLQRAFPSPDDADRRAVIQALGELKQPRAATELADIYVLRGDDHLGLLALEQLRRQGDLVASPALIPHLSHPNVEIRQQVARVLGEFQNPAALPELLSMLSEDAGRVRVIALVAGITGQDVTGRNDRAQYLRNWWIENRGSNQGEWLILALDQLGVQHALRPDQFGQDAGPSVVPELTRLVMDAEQPWIRSLSARMLRVNTQQDFGVVMPMTPPAGRSAICERYISLYEQDKAASGQ